MVNKRDYQTITSDYGSHYMSHTSVYVWADIIIASPWLYEDYFEPAVYL